MRGVVRRRRGGAVGGAQHVLRAEHATAERGGRGGARARRGLAAVGGAGAGAARRRPRAGRLSAARHGEWRRAIAHPITRPHDPATWLHSSHISRHPGEPHRVQF